jgi:hypothetical protein
LHRFAFTTQAIPIQKNTPLIIMIMIGNGASPFIKFVENKIASGSPHDRKKGNGLAA